MFYPSLSLLPLPVAIFTLINQCAGPLPCIQTAESTSKIALKIAQKLKISRQCDARKMQKSLRRLQRLIRLIPRAACLETACALKIWLALGGQKSQIQLGKRTENATLLMHAWLDAEPAPFFYDSRFTPIIIEQIKHNKWGEVSP